MAPITIDPAWFDEASIAPQTAKVNAEVEALLASRPTIGELGAPAVRAARGAGQALLAKQPES